MTRKAPPKVPLLAGLVDPRLTGARCAGRAPMFDAELEEESIENRSSRLAAAARICRGCPVLSACRTAGLELDNPTGLWAGNVHGQAGRPQKEAVA